MTGLRKEGKKGKVPLVVEPQGLQCRTLPERPVIVRMQRPHFLLQFPRALSLLALASFHVVPFVVQAINHIARLCIPGVYLV